LDVLSVLRASTIMEAFAYGEELEEDEEERECEECGDCMDPEEAEDGLCYSCIKSMRAYRVQRNLPGNFRVQEVAGNHRKPCTDCGNSYWEMGDYYVTDVHQPWGADKLCLDCAEMRNWSGTDEDDEDILDEEEDEYMMQDRETTAAPAVAAFCPQCGSRSLFRPSGTAPYCTACEFHKSGIARDFAAVLAPQLEEMKRRGI